MQLSNYHSHCTFCDGRSIPEDFVRFAITHGFRAYGFSSHSPLPFETFWNMSKDDMPEYLQEINRLKQKLLLLQGFGYVGFFNLGNVEALRAAEDGG